MNVSCYVLVKVKEQKNYYSSSANIYVLNNKYLFCALEYRRIFPPPFFFQSATVLRAIESQSEIEQNSLGCFLIRKKNRPCWRRL